MGVDANVDANVDGNVDGAACGYKRNFCCWGLCSIGVDVLRRKRAIAHRNWEAVGATLDNVFERFTDRARRALSLAQEEARLRNDAFIGTEHLLLGLIHEGEGLAAHALASLDVTLDSVREKVQEMRERPGPTGSGPKPAFTPRAKKVLEGALREALQLGHRYIGTEHLLLGITRQGEGAAIEVLHSLGTDLPHVRAAVIGLMSEHREHEGNDEESSPPYCPRCGDPLNKTLRSRWMQATDETTKEMVAVTVIYCGTCGTALGRRS